MKILKPIDLFEIIGKYLPKKRNYRLRENSIYKGSPNSLRTPWTGILFAMFDSWTWTFLFKRTSHSGVLQWTNDPMDTWIKTSENSSQKISTSDRTFQQLERNPYCRWTAVLDGDRNPIWLHAAAQDSFFLELLVMQSSFWWLAPRIWYNSRGNRIQEVPQSHRFCSVCMSQQG